jgi:hypothetical protein
VELLDPLSQKPFTANDFPPLWTLRFVAWPSDNFLVGHTALQKTFTRDSAPKLFQKFGPCDVEHIRTMAYHKIIHLLNP